MAELEQWPARVGAAGAGGRWAAEAARFVVATLRLAGPGMLALGVFAGAVANYVVARLLPAARRPGSGRSPQEAVPDHLVWGAIAGGLLSPRGRSGLETLGLNLLLVLTPLYAIQGLAVFRHFFLRVGRATAPPGARASGCSRCSRSCWWRSPCVGLSDLWIDFRKIRQAPTAAPE